MVKYLLSFCSVLVLFSCHTNDKGINANNKGPNDGKEQEIVKVKDTINVFEIIDYNLLPKKLEPQAAGGESKEVVSKTIFKYDDSNKDTILVTMQVKGFILPPAIGNPPPKRPYEEFNNYKFYKANEKWKVEELK
jgi:hypothetical protein